MGTILPAFFADKVGRKRGVVYLAIPCAIFGVAYAFVQTPLLIAMIGFAVVSIVMGLNAFVIAMYIPESFPTDLRMRGTGFCVTMSRIAAAVSPYLILTIYKAYQVPGVACFIVSSLVILAVTFGFFVTETKDKSLEELSVFTEDSLIESKLKEN